MSKRQKMIDFQNGKIYTIRNNSNPDLIYVGSTCDKLCNRLAKHKYDSKVKPNCLFYSQIKDWNDWYIELYENYPCKNTKELKQKEGEIIRKLGTLNKRIENRRKQEYNEIQTEKISATRKAIYERNKDLILQKHKNYYQNNKEKIRDCNNQWKYNNPEKIREIQQRYYEKNKTYYSEKQKEEVVCECGCTITKYKKSRHE